MASCVIGRIRLPWTFPVTQKTWQARGFQGPKGVQVEDRGMASVSHTSLSWNFVFLYRRLEFAPLTPGCLLA